MQQCGQYEYWAENVKFNINEEWQKATLAYTNDFRLMRGQKPASSDPKYSVSGFSVMIVLLYE